MYQSSYPLFSSPFKLFYGVVFSVLVLSPGLVSSAETQVNQDYHLSLYKDVQDSVDALELFTKAEQTREFFGISCSMQSPMPLIQVILFDDEIMSETTKLLSVKLFVDGVEQEGVMNGVVKVIDTSEELSNKIRLELVAERGTSLQNLQQQYKDLLNRLQQGQELTIQLRHRSLEPKSLNFSLHGLKELLKPHQSVCF
ncbi:hypothetical protein THMIRHAM_04290 [Thiomicrorhabdus immobilis]|uniref:Uncharacterized protein n=1 Tax=Thiomicrorhabdus immobilis TaxID=2791037 RepID=A0ABM7MBA2_9GAMM|nr:hypothetical protein [Thiomicrorhabdus immobilis]BCN92644.1 hypothetical protein THMIRHAM_04290 [Thiomicrorhabdus immobilis]